MPMHSKRYTFIGKGEGFICLRKCKAWSPQGYLREIVESIKKLTGNSLRLDKSATVFNKAFVVRAI